MLRRLVFGMAAALATCGVAGADPITIFNTGVNETGVTLPGGSVDPHWRIVQGTAAFPGPEAYVTNAGFPIPPWTANTTLSRWISPDANGALPVGDGATFVYRTTFDLTGLLPSSALLSGRWASDNQTLEIRLNDVNAGVGSNCTGPSDPTCYDSYDPFSISSGFVSGVNTLDFVVRNGVGPSGLRVEVSGSANAVAEPGTLLLLGGGMIGLALVRRRRR